MSTVRISLESCFSDAAFNGKLVGIKLLKPLDKRFPHLGARNHLHGICALVPAVEIPDNRNRLCLSRPYSEIMSLSAVFLALMTAEKLVCH